MKISRRKIRRLIRRQIKEAARIKRLDEVKGMNLGKTGSGAKTFKVDNFVASHLDDLVNNLSSENPSKGYVNNAVKQFKNLGNKDPAKFKSLMDALLKEPMFSQTTSSTPESMKATIDAQRRNLLKILNASAPEGVTIPGRNTRPSNTSPKKAPTKTTPNPKVNPVEPAPTKAPPQQSPRVNPVEPPPTKAPPQNPAPVQPTTNSSRMVTITKEMIEAGKNIPADDVKAFLKTSAGEELEAGMRALFIQMEKETGEKLGEKVLIEAIEDTARGALVGMGHGGIQGEGAVVAKSVLAGAGYKSLAFRFVGSTFIGLGLTGVVNWLMGRPTDQLITKTDLAFAAGFGVLELALPGVAAALWPLAIAGGAIALSEYFAGDMSDLYTNVMKSAKSNLGLTYGAYKGGYDFTADKDFAKIAAEKGYPDGVLSPKDIDPKRKQAILGLMCLWSAYRRKLLPPAEMKKYEGSKMDLKNPIGKLNMLFVNGALNLNDWFALWKKTYRPNDDEAKVVISKPGSEESKTGDGEGDEKITDPGKKVVKRFDWDKYVGNDPVESDKQQIKALWIQSVAEKVGSKKSFNSWARWYKNLYTKGEIGIDNQKLEDGQVLGGSGKNKNFKSGRHLSPDQVEFIMRKIHKGQKIDKDLGPINENKITISNLLLNKIVKAI